MIRQAQLKNNKEALEVINRAIAENGLDGLMQVLADYSEDVAMADGNERQIAGTNAMKITLALSQIADKDMQQKALVAWYNASRIAIAFNEATNSMESQADAVLQELVGLDEMTLDEYPLSHFCVPFQNWAMETEAALFQALNKQYSVHVYEAADKGGEDVICLVVCKEIEPQQVQSMFKMLLPMSCIQDALHFIEQHLDSVNEKVGEFIKSALEQNG